MSDTATVKGLTVEEAFTHMLDDPNIELSNKKSYRNRLKNEKITLNKMIEILESNGYKCVQNQIFIKG